MKQMTDDARKGETGFMLCSMISANTDVVYLGLDTYAPRPRPKYL